MSAETPQSNPQERLHLGSIDDPEVEAILDETEPTALSVSAPETQATPEDVTSSHLVGTLGNVGLKGVSEAPIIDPSKFKGDLAQNIPGSGNAEGR